MIADIALPVSYDLFLLGTRIILAAILLGFLWRVMIIVGRDALTVGATGSQASPTSTVLKSESAKRA